MKPPILWDDFQPGTALGEITQTFTPALARAWQDIFGEGSGPAEGAGIAVAMMMRGFLNVVAPRPPGNVHARQHFELLATPVPGEAIRTRVDCRSKEMRRGRRYLELQIQGSGAADRPVYRGVLTLIWAA